jgi:copper/silver efflux system protein
MISRCIAWCSQQPIFVVLATLVGIVWGIYAMQHIPLDAIPDLSDPQVIVFTEWKGRSPDLIEDQITYPIVSAMVAAPRVTDARGYSMFGMSFVYILFEEDTDLYWARSRTLEYMAKVQGQLPEGTNPTLGPDASGVGWVLQYSIVDRSGKNSIEDLRSFQDWKLRYLLEAIPGVAEVASVGGYVKQYQIQLNPHALLYYQLSLHQVMETIRASNRDVGGRTLELSEREYFIRGRGYLKSLTDIENIPVAAGADGAPVLVKHIANVTFVPDIRRGGTDLNGQGEAASAIVVARYGADAFRVITQVKDELDNVATALPEGAHIEITYDRSRLIGRSINTLTKKLIEEMLVVGAVIVLFLFHFRSALVPIITLPIAILLSFIPMYYSGVSSNIMSLGGIAIAIGAMVDAAIILIENCHKRMEEWEASDKKTPLADVLLHACQEVARPIFFSLIVIAVSFLPIFVLQGQEGRLFTPLAFTKNYAMLFAAIVAITLAPVLIQWLLKTPRNLRIGPQWIRALYQRIWVGTIYSEEHHPLSRWLHRLYEPVLRLVLLHRKRAILISGIAVLSIVPIYAQLGQEFMPPLNEGDLLYMPTTLPGISIEKAKEWLQQQDKLILKFGEVDTVFGKIGRASTATDPAPLSMVETIIQLHPQDEWPKIERPRWYSSWAPSWLKWPLGLVWPEQSRRGWDELIEALNMTVQLPGTTNAWVFPIKTRIDMLTTGIRTPIGVKIFGDDLAVIEKIAVQVEQEVQTLPGTRSVIAERSQGGYYVDIQLDQQRLAPYGLTIEQANQLIEGVIGGATLTTIIKGRERYPVNMRYQPAFRSSVEQLRRATVSVTPTKHIPLGDIATITVSRGPPMIKDENGLLTSWVFVDLETGEDMQGYVDRLQDTLQTPGLFPTGYTFTVSGQFAFMQRAKKRLLLVIPVTLLIIVILLYMNTHSWVRTGIVLLAVPFSLVGAFWLLYLLGYKLSVAVWVGMIALAGVDAETGVIMLLYLDMAYSSAKRRGAMQTTADLHQAMIDGAVKRVRPKMMTVITLFFGLLPIMWSGVHEIGADTMKRIAAPMVGGIFTSFLLELLIYPCIYMLWKERGLKHEESA